MSWHSSMRSGYKSLPLVVRRSRTSIPWKFRALRFSGRGRCRSMNNANPIKQTIGPPVTTRLNVSGHNPHRQYDTSGNLAKPRSAEGSEP